MFSGHSKHRALRRLGKLHRVGEFKRAKLIVPVELARHREIKGGSFVAAGGTPIPPVNSIINQGGRNLTTSGTQLTHH